SARVGVFGRFVLLLDDPLPAAGTVLHVRVVGVRARTEDVARRPGRRLAVEPFDVNRRQLLARDVIGTVVVRRRQVVVTVGPRPVDERGADEDDAAAVEVIRIGRGYRGHRYGA